MPKGEQNRKLSDAQREALIRRYLTPNATGAWDGCTILAREFGITGPAVLYNLRRAGIAIRDNRTSHGNGKRCKPVVNLPVGVAPPCKCGCGRPVPWHQRRNRWFVYVPGHYRRPAAYKDADWLHAEYETAKRPAGAIAAQFQIGASTIYKFLRKFGIPIRPQAESLALSGAVRGPNNPAWKGGVAKWAYAPEWKRIARRIRKRDHYTCQMCGAEFPKSSKLLHVHHIDAQKSNNADTNLVTVCASCHPKGQRRERAAAAQWTEQAVEDAHAGCVSFLLRGHR